MTDRKWKTTKKTGSTPDEGGIIITIRYCQPHVTENLTKRSLNKNKDRVTPHNRDLSQRRGKEKEKREKREKGEKRERLQG